MLSAVDYGDYSWFIQVIQKQVYKFRLAGKRSRERSGPYGWFELCTWRGICGLHLHDQFCEKVASENQYDTGI
ncbi:unnamed protein product [marine sediment metagenome]|uniref:Uncharacterized protein n=1 Tax=marine sediment metagenome TaxID=412755 RepID=X1SF37_9ZZZZ